MGLDNIVPVLTDCGADCEHWTKSNLGSTTYGAQLVQEGLMSYKGSRVKHYPTSHSDLRSIELKS